jgi:hypothetical protein
MGKEMWKGIRIDSLTIIPLVSFLLTLTLCIYIYLMYLGLCI